jgi:hypothetical protein
MGEFDMCNEELITPLNTDNIADETDTDGMFTVTSDECLVDGVIVKDGAIYFGSSNEKIEDAPIEVLDLSARDITSCAEITWSIPIAQMVRCLFQMFYQSQNLSFSL